MFLVHIFLETLLLFDNLVAQRLPPWSFETLGANFSGEQTADSLFLGASCRSCCMFRRPQVDNSSALFYASKFLQA